MAADSSNNEDVKTVLTSKQKVKSVQIREDRPQIVEVTEKHGPLYNAIPCMPIGVAAILCIFNILVPGFGKCQLNYLSPFVFFSKNLNQNYLFTKSIYLLNLIMSLSYFKVSVSL